MNTQHRLRCMLALGYPPAWIADRIGVTVPTVVTYTEHGTGLTEDQHDLVHRLAKTVGEQVATPETCGYGTTSISRVRLSARSKGYLPPMAFDQDEDGNDVNGDPAACETRRKSGRTIERAAMDRLDLLRHALLMPTLSCEEIAARLGIPVNWDREIRPIRMSDLRSLHLDVTAHTVQPWPDPALRRHILDVVAIAHRDGDYCWGWDVCVTLWAERHDPQGQFDTAPAARTLVAA